MFYPLRNSDEDFDLLASLGIVCEASSRTDIYISASEAFGLKARGASKGKLELKIRLSRKKRGAENWEKITGLRGNVESGMDVSKVNDFCASSTQFSCQRRLYEVLLVFARR